MTTPTKETLYKTAYSPLYEVYVSIDNAFQDEDGNWIFQCSCNYGNEPLSMFLFRKNELTNFCL